MRKNSTAQPRGASVQSAPGMGEAWLAMNMARVKRVGAFAEFCDIDPSRAQALLDRNPDNRAIVASGVRAWAESLRRGEWQMNGEPVIIADTGEVNDGQHRLSAVVETGITLPTLVVFGVTRASRKTVDTGQKRTAGHVLGMMGVSNGHLAAAALKAIVNLEARVNLATHRTSLEIERAYAAHPAIHSSFTTGTNVNRTFGVPTGLSCALCYLMARKDAEKAATFFDMLLAGVAPTRDHPVAALRGRLMGNMLAKAKLPPHEIAALCIKAWNAFVEGRAVRALRWRNEGETPEAFPRIGE